MSVHRLAAIAAIFSGFFIFVSVAVFGGPAKAEPIGDATVGYRAQIVIEAEGRVIRGTTFHKPGRRGGPGLDRFELSMNGDRRTIIVRPDYKAAWILLPERNLYAEYDLTDARELIGVLDDSRVRLAEIGEERVAGHATRRYRYEGVDGRNNPIQGEIWMTADEIVLRMDGVSVEGGRERRLRMELQDVSIETVDPPMFELPEGFRRVGD